MVQNSQLSPLQTALIAVLAVMLCWACAEQEQVHELSGQAWGTTYQIKLITGQDGFDEAAFEAAVDAALVDVDEKLSNWNPQSEVSRFNGAATPEQVALSPMFNTLMQVAGDVHTRSDGFFDVTLAPVIELWGFGAAGGAPGDDRTAPSDLEIAGAMAMVGQKSVLDHDFTAAQMRKRNPDATVFLSALAKGAGIDAIHTSLSDLGYDNYLIEVGGDLIAMGPGPSGDGWRIGVERPGIGPRPPHEVVPLSDIAMATSGDYRNYFEHDGVRFSHIIDPRVGRPITHRTASVTVLAETAAMADAWATALLVAGEEAGMAIAERENIAALFITRTANKSALEFESVASPAFAQLRPTQED